MRSFGSDNHSGIHPQILQAIESANHNHAPSYGTDEISLRLNQQLGQLFGKQVTAYGVYNGTAANVLCLRAALRPWQSVICTDISHLNLDECGAPEFLAGVKLLPLKSENGKLSLAQIKDALQRRGDQHYSQPKLISLTQPTEVGTCYSLEELREITKWAHQNELFVHVDGARLANAVTYLSSSFKEMTTDVGIDILSLGGTKNGLMVGELVVLLNPALTDDFKYIRKQSGQLPSKSRFIAAQFEAYFTNFLWKEIAEHSLKQAKKLANLLSLEKITSEYPVQSNAVFVRFPKAWIKPLREKYFFYVWDEKTFCCRLMTSFDTKDEDLHGFIQAVKQLT